MEESIEKYLIHWHEYGNHVASAVQSIHEDEELFDVTIACKDHTVRAHKLVLAASSDYFRKIFKEYPCEHPTIILEDISWLEFQSLLYFMYHGKVTINENLVAPLLAAANSLSIYALNYLTEALDKAQTTKKNDINRNPSHKKRLINVPSEEGLTNPNESSEVKAMNPTKKKKDENHKLSDRENGDWDGSASQSAMMSSISDERETRPIPLDILPKEVKLEKPSYYENSAAALRLAAAQCLNGSASVDREHSIDVNENAAAILSSFKPDLDSGSHDSEDSKNAFHLSNYSLPETIKSTLSQAALYVNGESSTNGFSDGGGVSLPKWMTNHDSRSPSPPEVSNPSQSNYVHPIGYSIPDMQATLEQYQRRLAFHEPRPCPMCRRVYRDAATLRTHIAIMHSAGTEAFSCTCGILFQTKHDMLQHKKNGHR